MGMQCPECDTYQAQVRVITIDDKPPKKAADVIAVELACGHIVGSQEYTEYANARNALLKEQACAMEDVHKEYRHKLGQLFKDFHARNQEVA